MHNKTEDFKKLKTPDLSIKYFSLNVIILLTEVQTGKKHVEYLAVERNQIAIHAEGLPDGIVFKKPCFYKNEELNAIVASKDNITLHGKKNVPFLVQH